MNTVGGLLANYPFHKIMFYTMIVSVSAVLCVGPSHLLGYPISGSSTFSGVALNGFITSFIEIYTVPIII